MRINQYVAAATGCSRRAADTAIAAGRVAVNGVTAALGQTVAPDNKVTFDGAAVSLPQTRLYLIFHKPAGYVTSRTRQGNALTIYDLLPAKYHQLRPAGRLDLTSSGLLLLSDDGEFIHQLTHPSHGKIKRYELTLTRPVSPGDLRRLEQGVKLADGLSRLQIVQARGRHLTVDLSEGRNRQIRRTLGALGYEIQRLHRISVGPYRLDSLGPGAWLAISPETRT